MSERSKGNDTVPSRVTCQDSKDRAAKIDNKTILIIINIYLKNKNQGRNVIKWIVNL